MVKIVDYKAKVNIGIRKFISLLYSFNYQVILWAEWFKTEGSDISQI